MIKVDEADPVGELEPTFPYRDVAIKRGVDMKEYYDLEGEIGRGKFGTVYKCREKGTNLTLAAKFVGIARRQDRKNVEREVEIMRTLQHPRLIQLYDAFETDNVMCVVLELIEGGELFERVIDDDFILTEKACTVFMRQICEGVAFIHSNNIIHLDLKPENILCLTKTGNRIKIIDFGLARKFEPEKKLQVLFGTPEFVAPEVVNFDQISCATDMWSVGVICYVLLSGLSPFMGETDVETMANVTIARYDFEDDSFDEISPEAKDFIAKLLMKDKEARLTAVECLSHPWLRRQIPPPPPTLDTTKDNLRNYVENSVPYISTPIIIKKGFNEKPGLIEKIIENEHKVINSHFLSNSKNEIPILPILNDTRQEQNIFKPEHLLKSVNQTYNDREGLPSGHEIKNALTPGNIQDNNNKNSNLLTSSNLPNQMIFDSLSSKTESNTNLQNLTKLAERIPILACENKERTFLDTISANPVFNAGLPKDKTIDFKDSKPKVNVSTSNPSSEINPVKLLYETKGKNLTLENSIRNMPIENKPPGIPIGTNSGSMKMVPTENKALSTFIENKNTNMHVENKVANLPTGNKVAQSPIDQKLNENAIKMESLSNSDLFQSHQKVESKLLETLSNISKKGTHEVFLANQQQNNKTEVKNTPNKTIVIPTVVVPSLSSQPSLNPSSDFSLINFKLNDTFSNKLENHFIPDFMKNTSNKKPGSERSQHYTSLNDTLSKETVKENDASFFKQHLRSTPPWFSELSNQGQRRSTTDRFDRRSSDFSCFLHSQDDTSDGHNLADEIRKLSYRLLQMSANQTISQDPSLGGNNTRNVQNRSRNDPISCFLENHGITHPRPKFKFSNLNRDVPIGSPPPPSNIAYYLNMSSSSQRKDSHSAPDSPRASPEKTSESFKKSSTSNSGESLLKKESTVQISQDKISTNSMLEHVKINKTNKKLNFPV